MSPLAERKARLRERIAVRRLANAAAARRVAQPLRWIDDGVRLWQKLPPLARGAAVPSVLLLLKAVFPRVRTLLRWSPILMGIWRTLRSLRRHARAAST